jgi:hypothetical protein
VPAKTSRRVTFWIPLDGDGWIKVNGMNIIAWSDVRPYAGQPDCEFYISIPEKLDFTLGCALAPERGRNPIVPR